MRSGIGAGRDHSLVYSHCHTEHFSLVVDQAIDELDCHMREHRLDRLVVESNLASFGTIRLRETARH